jgi:hypothetical protein
VFLTPALLPVFGGTYFPPQGNYGRPGFKQVPGRLAPRSDNDIMTRSLAMTRSHAMTRPEPDCARQVLTALAGQWREEGAEMAEQVQGALHCTVHCTALQ